VRDWLVFDIPWSRKTSCAGVFADTERSTALVSGKAQCITERHEIEVPHGCTLYGEPLDKRLECAWGSYRCSVQFDSGRLLCERRLVTADGIVPPDNFPALRSFWEACSWSDSTPILLSVSR
jgi:hypothetical protein